MRMAKKAKYKEFPVKDPFRVVADYQPAYMDSPPDIRTTYHKTFESALVTVDELKDSGMASGINVVQVLIRLNRK